MNTRLRGRRRVAHSVLTLVGMTGIAVLFLPFTSGVSPADAVVDKDLWSLALPFFLSPFAVAASLRWIVSGSLSRLERIIAYIVSTAAATATLSQYWPFDDWPSGPQDWLVWLMPPAILLCAVCLLIRNSRMTPASEFNPVMSIHMVYLANGALCLIGFFGDWEVGAYFALVAASMFTLQTILVAVQGADRGTELQAA